MGCYCCVVRKVAGTRTGTRDGCNGTFHSPPPLVLDRCVGFGRRKLTTLEGIVRAGMQSRELTVRSRLRGYANHSHSFRNAGPSDASSWYGGRQGAQLKPLAPAPQLQGFHNSRSRYGVRDSADPCTSISVPSGMTQSVASVALGNLAE